MFINLKSFTFYKVKHQNDKCFLFVFLSYHTSHCNLDYSEVFCTVVQALFWFSLISIILDFSICLEGGHSPGQHWDKFYCVELHSFITGYMINVVLCISSWVSSCPQVSQVLLNPVVGYYLVACCTPLKPFFSFLIKVFYSVHAIYFSHDDEYNYL